MNRSTPLEPLNHWPISRKQYINPSPIITKRKLPTHHHCFRLTMAVSPPPQVPNVGYRNAGFSQVPNQPHFNDHLFETKLCNWLVDIPPANLDVTGSLPGSLPEDGQAVQRPGHSSITHVKIQLNDFWAASGSVGWPCRTLRLSVKAPGGLYPWPKTPTVHLYVPIVLSSALSVDDVREAFVAAAWELLKQHDPRETLRGQPLVRRLVGVTPLAPVVS